MDLATLTDHLKSVRIRYVIKIFRGDLLCFLNACGPCCYYREKEGDQTQSYDGRPYTNIKFNNQFITLKRHKNFDYTTIADRLRRVSWSKKSYPIGVVKPVHGYPTFPLTDPLGSHLSKRYIVSRSSFFKFQLLGDCHCCWTWDVKYKRTDALSLWHQQ